MVRDAASMTGVPEMPMGPSPQPAPVDCEAMPMLCIHSVAPVVSSSAKTLLPVVAAMKAPLPLGPLAM